MNYLNELNKAMNILAKNGYMFIGQNMLFGGTSMFHTIKNVPKKQRIEVPVFEDTQMGISIGMTLDRLKICSVYPRMDFLLLAFNQLINHADKVDIMSDNQFKLKGLIIRTAIGSSQPLMPGPQHCQDYTEALKLMCKRIQVVKLDKMENIIKEYQDAMNREYPTVLIEIPDLYNKDLTNDLIESRKIIIK